MITKGKLLFIVVGFLPLLLQAQILKSPKPNWQNPDLKTDFVFGISADNAYKELLIGKAAKKVLVGVIDGGSDLNQEDFKSVIWTTPKVITGNGKDDGKNAFIALWITFTFK